MPKHFKCLVLIQDGVGDRPIESLGNWTPLEAAHTPRMDSLVRSGQAGLMDVLGPGIRVGTDVGHLALFRQNTADPSYRRGPMEAAGIGVEVGHEDVALRFNFATVNERMELVDRRAGRIREETRELIESLNRMSLSVPVKAAFYRATEHRGVLVLSGSKLSDQVTDSDPGSIDGITTVASVQATVADAGAQITAAALNEIVQRSFEILDDHPVNRRRRKSGQNPANIILTRGAGKRQQYISLPDLLGMSVACISAESTVLGIARLVGAEAVMTPRMTANLDTDLSEKARQTVAALRNFDVVYLHLKGCDIAGHDRRPDQKRWFIERTDLMLGDILAAPGVPQNLFVALAGDHATPAELGEHSGDPVPVAISGPGIPADSVTAYGERSCAAGALGRLLCSEFLETLFGYVRSFNLDESEQPR